MIHLNKIIPLIILSAICMLSSCKRVAKEAVEEITEKTIAKKITKEFIEEELENITSKELKVIDWGDLYKIISKKYPILNNAIERMDGKIQKIITRNIQKDYKFYRALISSNTILDECEIYAKNAPQLMTDPDFIRMYVKSNIARQEGKHCIIKDLFPKYEDGFVKFYNQSSNKIVAEYRDGIVKTLDKSFLDNELIPNTCYTINRGNGKKIIYSIDNLGRITSIDAKNMSSSEILSDIINRKGQNDFGKNWDIAFRKLKQTSKKDDINIKCNFNYLDDSEIAPKYMHVDASINGKKRLTNSYENTIKRIGNTYSSIENSSLLKKYKTKLGLSDEKFYKLLQEMNSDDGLAELIHSNPNYNIKRWTKTRNHVNKKLFAKTPNGRAPLNARVYAGNTYYFNPHLNYRLKGRLKKGNGYVMLKTKTKKAKLDIKLSYDELVELDKLYPDGVPFTKEGFPDFSKIAQKDKNDNPIKINIGKLSGDSKADVSMAETLFQQQGNQYAEGYTWHHVENSTVLLRVPTKLHQLVDHTGGMSMSSQIK